MTHFVFDCDDVLLNWQSGFITYLTERGITPCPKGPQSWNLAPWLGCSQEAARSWVMRFNTSPSFSRLTPMRGAVETLWALHDAGHSISILTACGLEPSLRQARIQNLRDVFARGETCPWENVQMLALGESKFTHLYDIYEQVAGRTDICFVEDNFDNARSGVANGMTSYCLRRSHNRHHEDAHPDTFVKWIDTINEIACLHVQQTVE